MKRTAVPSADGHKDSSLGLKYFANEFFHEVGNVDLTSNVKTVKEQTFHKRSTNVPMSNRN